MLFLNKKGKVEQIRIVKHMDGKTYVLTGRSQDLYWDEHGHMHVTWTEHWTEAED